MAKWVYRPGHPKANERGFVAFEDMGYAPEPEAKNANIMAGRFYENMSTAEGEDIGSRRKHKDYMRRNGVTTVDDFKDQWEKAKAQREAIQRGEHDRKERREQVERAIWEHNKP